jgi:N-ethylmaleimide reductase
MTASTKLFEPYKLGPLQLKNRIVMAPLTRNRAGPGNVPGPLAVTYYGQRASSGLIVSEATQVVPEGQGYQATPGIHSKEQIAGWRAVTDRVHERGGHMFLQLWHVGRISHVDLQPNKQKPVAPSAITAKTKTYVNNTFADTTEPRALTLEEIPGVIDGFRRGAANALAAGFDGAEVHGAHGYLLDQFARDKTNARTDSYGGSIENRVRFMVEVAAAVAQEAGAARTGIRISPVNPNNDIADSNPQPLFNHIVERIDALKLAYIHVVEGTASGPRDDPPFDYAALRARFRGTYIANNGYTQELANETVDAGRADLICFGRAYVANPDLVERFRRDAPLNDVNRATLYGGDERGYTDYPALSS